MGEQRSSGVRVTQAGEQAVPGETLLVRVAHGAPSTEAPPGQLTLAKEAALGHSASWGRV